MEKKYKKDPDCISNYFLDLNSGLPSHLAHSNVSDNVHTYDAPVITFTHFLPLQELLPPSQFSKKTLPLVTGCKGIEAQIRLVPNYRAY